MSARGIVQTVPRRGGFVANGDGAWHVDDRGFRRLPRGSHISSFASSLKRGWVWDIRIFPTGWRLLVGEPGERCGYIELRSSLNEVESLLPAKLRPEARAIHTRLVDDMRIGISRAQRRLDQRRAEMAA